MTLWVLFCRLHEGTSTGILFYARDRAHAEELAVGLLEEHEAERVMLLEGFIPEYFCILASSDKRKESR